MQNGQWTDLIADFMELTESVMSPDVFRLWSAIGLVAGAMERRVWAEAGDYITFPNLYVLLVAHPGVGKQVIELVRELWSETVEPGTANKSLKVAPDSMTKASLMDTLAKAKQLKLVPLGTAVTYHSLLIAAEEFSVLMPAYDMEYIGALNSIWQNKSLHEESRRTGSVRELKIENPQLNMLGGAAPSWLSSIFPENAWNTGLGRRIIMIYAGETPIKNIFVKAPDRQSVKARVLHKLGLIAQMYGSVTWGPEAISILEQWHLADRPPKPTHSKLVHYERSRLQHAIKLATISGISRTGERLIEVQDSRRALDWLFEAESLMPDIFRAMIGKSDRDVIDEMHLFVTATYARRKAKPVSGEAIRQFLLERLPHDKVESVILASEKANIIARVAGTPDLWVPRPRREEGQE